MKIVFLMLTPGEAKVVCERRWQAVPRAGDYVSLFSSTHLVHDVTWDAIKGQVTVSLKP